MINKITRGETKMDAELSNKVFRDVITVLNRLGVKYWLDDGTLLGAIREGDWINTDYDIDIGILYFRQGMQLYEELEKIGLNFDIDYFEVKGEKFVRKANILINSFCNRFAKLEIVPYYTVDNQFCKLTQQKEDGVYGSETPRKFFDKRDIYHFKEMFVKIPNNVEDYLEFLYGDWKTPRMDIPTTYKKDFVKIDEVKLVNQNI